MAVAANQLSIAADTRLRQNYHALYGNGVLMMWICVRWVRLWLAVVTATFLFPPPAAPEVTIVESGTADSYAQVFIPTPPGGPCASCGDSTDSGPTSSSASYSASNDNFNLSANASSSVTASLSDNVLSLSLDASASAFGSGPPWPTLGELGATLFGLGSADFGWSGGENFIFEVDESTVANLSYTPTGSVIAGDCTPPPSFFSISTVGYFITLYEFPYMGESLFEDFRSAECSLSGVLEQVVIPLDPGTYQIEVWTRAYAGAALSYPETIVNGTGIATASLDLTLDLESVPEPGTALGLATGSLLLAMMNQRRKAIQAREIIEPSPSPTAQKQPQQPSA